MDYDGQWPCKEERRGHCGQGPCPERSAHPIAPKEEIFGDGDEEELNMDDVPPVTLAPGQDKLTCGLCAASIKDETPPAFKRAQYDPFYPWAAYHNVKQKCIGGRVKKKKILARHPKGPACLGCKKTHRSLGLQTKFNCALIEYNAKYRQRGTP